MVTCKKQEIDKDTCLILFRGDERTTNVKSLGTTVRNEMLLAHRDHTGRVVSIELIDPIQKKCQCEKTPEHDDEDVTTQTYDVFDKDGRLSSVRKR